MRVSALTTGRNDPSARFRVRQHIGPLLTYGIEVQEHIPLIDKHSGLPSRLDPVSAVFGRPMMSRLWKVAKLACRVPGLAASRNADLVWMNRELLPGQYSLEGFIRRPIVLDVDDAIWLGKPDGARTLERLAKQAEFVIAGNIYLANWLSQWNQRVHIVPTAIDTERFAPQSVSKRLIRDAPFTLGWTGSSGNYGYLYNIEDALSEFLRTRDSRLLVMAETPPTFQRIPTDKVDYRKWSAATEATTLLEMDVGLMPLPDTPWTRGKCSFKMLQYMSSQLPVVVSPVGMNADILRMGAIGYGPTNESDWHDALAELYNDRAGGLRMGTEGRQIAVRNFSRTKVAEDIAGLFLRNRSYRRDRNGTDIVESKSQTFR